MYAAKIIESKLSAFSAANKWLPTYRSIEEVKELKAEISSITETRTNQKNKYISIKSNLSSSRMKEIRRKIENEQVLCSFDQRYWSTRYAFICDEKGEIFQYKPRRSQEVFHTVVAHFEELLVAIELFCLKGRQVGISTETALKFLHRLLFIPNTQAVMASVQSDKSELLSRIIETCYDRCPWWLIPQRTGDRIKKTEFANGSVLSIQSGSQPTGIGQGWTPTAIHISEIGDIPNPKKVIEEGLLRATHSSRKLFQVFEGTGNGSVGWQADYWRTIKEDYPKGLSRFCPVFIPPVLATDLYPEADWLVKFPIPDNWTPHVETVKYTQRCELYIRSTDYLSSICGSNYSIPREFQWFWEFNYLAAVKSHTQKIWRQQMPCVTGDTLVSTEWGMIRIDKAQGSKRCESGLVIGWRYSGNKKILKLTTKEMRVLSATNNHLIQMIDGSWKSMSALIKGDRIALRQPMFAAQEVLHEWNDTPIFKSQRKIDAEMGRLLGYFMGDGCFHSQELSIACDLKDQDTCADIVKLIHSVTGRVPTSQHVGNMVRVRSSNRYWVQLLRSIGVITPVIHVEKRPDGWRRKVCVPRCIYESPKHVVREFLRSLFECDGHATKKRPRVSLSSSHDEFLQEVQLLLLGFGIKAKIMKSEYIPGSSIKGAKRHSYKRRQLVIGAAFVNSFYSDIGFVGQRKQTSGKRQDANAYTANYSDKTLVDEVLSVDDAGEAEVFDLSVAGSRSFSANGIAVHNCDDLEALTGKNDLVFDHEVIEVRSRERQRDYQSYALLGNSVDDGFEPAVEIIDYNLPRIPIHYESNRGQIYDWILVPLLPFDESRESYALDRIIVFEPPKEGRDYTVGIDTADGLNKEDEDRSALIVTKTAKGNFPDFQAAEFVSLRINPPQMVAWAAAIGAWYGASSRDPRGVKFCIEQRERPGDDCQHQLKLMGFNFHHRMIRYDGKVVKENVAFKEGWYSNAWSVPFITNRFVDAVNNGWYTINSPFLINELTSYERKQKPNGKTVLIHQSGKKDDRIRAAAQSYITAHHMDVLMDRSKKEYRTNPSGTLPELNREFVNLGAMSVGD